MTELVSYYLKDNLLHKSALNQGNLRIKANGGIKYKEIKLRKTYPRRGI